MKSKSFWTSYFPVFALVTIWAIPTAYFQAFSQFAPYDDEGYLMMTVKQYLDGGVLYDQVYTQYGAVYYFIQAIFHKISGLPVTHNVTRFTTIIFWISTALLCGIFTSKLSRSAIGGAAAYVLTFLILFRTTHESGHPQEICGFLLVLSLLLLVDKPENRWFVARLGLLGATIALLFLIKINLGIFLGLAIAITFVAFSPKNIFQRLALVGLTLLAASLPFILFRKYLELGWFRLSTAISVCLISMLLTSLLKIEEKLLNLRSYLFAAAGFVVTLAAVLCITIAQGTTIEAFANGVFFQHLKFTDNFFQPAPVQRLATIWAIFAFIIALVILFAKRNYSELNGKTISILKMLFGLAVIAASLFQPFKYNNVFLLISFATPFLWLALLNLKTNEERIQSILPRFALVLTAILQPLQTFPISGTQTNYGVFLMAIVGVVCLHDALKELEFSFAQIFRKFYLRQATIGLLIVVFCLNAFYFTFQVSRNHQSAIPLPFKGAERVRLPEEDYALYVFLVENIRANCDALISVPGIYSLNFWSQIDPPTTFNATALLTLLNDSQQQAIIEKMRISNRGCAVYNPVFTKYGLRDKSPEDFALTDFIFQNYERAAKFRKYSLMIDPAQISNLTNYAKFAADSNEKIEFSLSDNQTSQISRIQIYDWQAKTIVADSQNQQIGLPVSINDRKFALQMVNTNLNSQNSLLLRFYDANGKLLTSIPFLSDQF